MLLLRVFASGGSGNSVSRGRTSTNRSASVLTSSRKSGANPTSETTKIAKGSQSTISGSQYVSDFATFVRRKTGRHFTDLGDEAAERLTKEFNKSIGNKKIIW